MNGIQAHICHGCGSFVADTVKHAQWHEVMKSTVSTLFKSTAVNAGMKPNSAAVKRALKTIEENL